MAEEEKWDKRRACILPITMTFAFCYFLNLFSIDAASKILISLLIMLVPGFIFSIYILINTKKTVPPPNILTLFSILAFIMSIAWIKWLEKVDLAKGDPKAKSEQSHGKRECWQP